MNVVYLFKTVVILITMSKSGDKLKEPILS